MLSQVPQDCNDNKMICHPQISVYAKGRMLNTMSENT